ncbi:hypothetical protein [Methanogenium organophilum]|uniref:Uncharacterized protein n=1 Tax=Methanogenium organophilum TaxID=2199 RepID=A0A9X9S598_METOG|nr:hypothetical protein [Methanogenium organophilum]WAI02339.1 hypothetical protein OU421_05560 [Methanogenium organophilum]
MRGLVVVVQKDFGEDGTRWSCHSDGIYFGFSNNFQTFLSYMEKTEFLWAILDTDRTAESIAESYDPE